MVTGAVALAEFAKVVADKYGITVALHTDHCQKEKLDTYVKPLLAISTERVKAGGQPLFQSHMWDGSAVPLDENLKIAEELLRADQGRERHPRDRGRRGRRRGGRRRARDQRQALHLARRLHRHRSTRSACRRTTPTSSPRPSATCTASTSPAASSSVPPCSRRARTRWPPSSACRPAPSRSPWCSTAARAPRRRRSPRRCPTE